MKFPIIAFAALFLSAAAAKQAEAESAVTKSAWLEAMKTAIPNAFCSGKGLSRYFRECFKVTEDQCIEEALRAVKVCILSMTDQMPDELHSPDDGRTWGRKLGACAGTGFEIALKLTGSHIDSADCKDITKFK